jgi:hypothetical protein
MRGVDLGLRLLLDFFDDGSKFLRAGGGDRFSTEVVVGVVPFVVIGHFSHHHLLHLLTITLSPCPDSLLENQEER